MDIQTENVGGALILKPSGRVDGQNALEFQASIDKAIEGASDGVILDLSQLTYISSAGLRVILLLAKTLRNQDVKFAMCSISSSVQDVFEISGFGKIIPTHVNHTEALNSFKK